MTADIAPPVEDLEQVVETCEREAVAAIDLVSELEQRVLQGDPEVTPEEFEQAKGLAKFARMRAEGAARRKAAAGKAQLEAEVARVSSLVRDALGVEHAGANADQEEFEATVEAAAAKLMRSAMRRRNAALAIVQEATALDVPEYDPSDSLQTGLRKSYDRVALDDRVIAPHDAMFRASKVLNGHGWHQGLADRAKAAAEAGGRP